MAEPLFVERIHLLGPAGFHDAVKQAAREAGATTSEYIRQAIRTKMNGNGQGVGAVEIAGGTIGASAGAGD